MNNDDDLVDFEDLRFDSKSGECTASHKNRTRGKKSAEELFDKVKVKMVMRIYGVSQAKAREIIAARTEETMAEEDGSEDYSCDE